MPAAGSQSMVVILLGPPGVGKGTQGARLMDEYGFEKIATGDLLRAARAEGTALGREAQAVMDAGELVPDDLIVALVEEKLASLESRTPILFDGFPRTVPQAEALERALDGVGRQVDRVIVLEAPEDVVVRRISGRRISPGGRVYNVYYDPPAREGRCDDTGEPLIHREDDQPDTVRRRLQVYLEQTHPLVAHYESGPGAVVRVDADRPVEAIYEELRSVVDSIIAGAGEHA